MPTLTGMTTLVGIDLAGRRVVVAGGGRVAARRAADLVTEGADVLVVSPTVSGPLRALPITWVPRVVEPDDLAGAWLVQAATDDAEVNRAVAGWARERRIWCVQAGRADEGTARTPAIAREAGLVIGVLSDGEPDPRRVRWVRDQLRAVVHRTGGYRRAVRSGRAGRAGSRSWVA